MTTPSTQRVSAFLTVSGAISPALKRFQMVRAEGGMLDVLVEGLAVTSAATTKAMVYRICEGASRAPAQSTTSDFDALLAEAEAAPEMAEHLAEGRRWVGRTFYPDSATLGSLRLGVGLSQGQLAKLCGVEQPHISRYESARHVPSLPMAHTLAKHLGVSLDEFFSAWENTQVAAHAIADHTAVAP